MAFHEWIYAKYQYPIMGRHIFFLNNYLKIYINNKKLQEKAGKIFMLLNNHF